MVACFFGKTGHVAIYLSNVAQSILSGTPQFACSHISAQTSAFLTGQNVESIHPPYSPDVASNDFSLFPNK